MKKLLTTPLHGLHLQHGAKMVDFNGWEMPIQYPDGILQEHLETRTKAGVFDISHMGRFTISGEDALPFLQFILTNNSAALRPGESQYTLIQNATGGALDDAYLYRFDEASYLLVVNAANREKDWHHFLDHTKNFSDLNLEDITHEMAMLSLQGPMSKTILESIITAGILPEPTRNSCSTIEIQGEKITIARTGYTGEPLCFELFVHAKAAAKLWQKLIAAGATPVGLGARDTLRLEAGLPLYGHELGKDRNGDDIPIFSSKLSRFSVSFSPLKGDFLGKKALEQQFHCLKKILHSDFSDTRHLPRMICNLAITGKGVARAGYEVYQGEKSIGYITSGTMVPYPLSTGSGMDLIFSGESNNRALCLAYLDSNTKLGDLVQVQVRKKLINAVVVPYHLASEAPPHSYPILHDSLSIVPPPSPQRMISQKVSSLIEQSIKNTRWRQEECINLIPSEQTQSSMSRLLTITDTCGRYAEHKEIKAFSHADVFYYQGIDFIEEVERLLKEELCFYFKCQHVEPRLISGQMANTAAFSAMVDFINRADRKMEPKRIASVMNNHIIRGGHLSAQPMGALRDFVARDPITEKPAIVNFPVLDTNPHRIDIEASRALIKEHQPELLILGKSMTLHREPVKEMREILNEFSPDSILLYDMAHVLGLYGQFFQEPLSEGADLITGSTHKTFFGTQRGIIATNIMEDDNKYPLWEAIKRRTFPGSVSNHHLGTLLGLLMATYEMNTFKDEYQKQVITNAKAFALALHDSGLEVAGDPENSFTETHQVIVNVGYAVGYEIAKRLEENNIIVNYQATAEEEGFTAAGALRMGVAEMTRFGMKPKDFQLLAQMMHDIIKHNASLKEEVTAFRKNYRTMNFCFQEKDYEELLEELHNAI